LTKKIDKLKRKFVEIIVVLTRICRLEIVKKFRDIKVFVILKDAKLLLTIKNIEFLIVYKNANFLIVLIDLISKEKLFLFIIKECVKKNIYKIKFRFL